MNWAKELVLSEIMAENVGRQIAKVLAPPLQAPKITPFPDPHQIATVPAGETKQVYYFAVPGGAVGFIQFIANTYYYGDYVYFYIDGKLKESPYIQRMLGSINAPTETVPWFKFPVKEEIVWKVRNNDVEDHEYEILCDGFYVSDKDLPLLFRMAGVK